jgi:DNA-binding transcriptional regulator YiaG
VIIGGALGSSALDATSSVAANKPSDYELSREWTNTGPTPQEADPTQQTLEGASAKLIAELRRISGLTWQHLARLFDVDRRSVHFWASGRAMSDSNAEHLARLVASLRQVDRGDPAKTRAWLLAPSHSGELPLDILIQKRYEDLGTPAVPLVAHKRPPAISLQASARRLPPAPSRLLQGAAPEKKPAGERLLASQQIKVKRSE